MNAKIFPLEIATMQEVATRIKHKDSESAKKWCIENNIAIHRISKKDYIYLIDLEYTIGKPFVSNLQIKHPHDWKIILKDILDNDALYNYFLANLGEPRNNKGLTLVKPKNKEEEMIYKNLLS